VSSLATFRKLQKKQSDDLKKKILSEFAISIDALANDEELEPWAEVADGKEYTLKKIESVASFGMLVLTFAPKDNPDHELRLPLQLKGLG
jgi:hypothetical protein